MSHAAAGVSHTDTRAFEIAEWERDRALTAQQLDEVEGVVGMGAYRVKYARQLARIDTTLARLRIDAAESRA